MAGNTELGYTQAAGMDYPEHERTYNGFIAGTKWGTLTLIGVLLLMFFFLT